MSKISKMLILSLVVVSLASASFATTSRVIALAGTSNYINDDSNIFRWYGTLPSYTNMVMAEAGQATGTIGPSGNGDLFTEYQALGFTHSWGEDHWLGTWAVFLLYNSVEDMSFYNFNPLAGIGTEGTNSTPTTKFVFSWGNEIEDVVSYGINFTRSDASFETTAGGTNDINYTTIGGGARFDVGEDAYVDAAATFGFAGGDSLGGFDNGKAWDLAARLFWEVRDDVTVVPFLGWRAFDLAYEDLAATSGLKSSDFQAGASLNFDVNTNNMLIFATEIEFVTLEPSKVAPGDQNEIKVTHLPKFFVALESDVTSWLTTRVGATKTMRKIEDTDFAGDESISTAPSFEGGDFDWSLGAGFHVGEWDIDAVFSHEIPFRLGYWLTGYGVGDLDPPVGRVSGTYRF
ncbi:MAG: hypothetical protein OEN01_01285 [Candidatus Krumholzibacteria bacterium]|nr:hypothetical protein [Candidatus Krumholzibacteria bacterium]